MVAFVKERGAELVVVGSRGMGAARSTLMSLIGLGSVSSKLRQPWGFLPCFAALHDGRMALLHHVLAGNVRKHPSERGCPELFFLSCCDFAAWWLPLAPCQPFSLVPAGYLVHNLHYPVAVYRGRADNTAAKVS